MAQEEFSGIWILDQTKSDATFRDYQITCIITQTLKTFTVDQVLVTKDGEEIQIPSVTYDLSGKEVIKEEQDGKSRIRAEWAYGDHRTLIVNYRRNISGKDVGSITTYKLADNGQFLTIKLTDLDGDSPVAQVYRKK